MEAYRKGGRGRQSIIRPNFPENCMKMKKLGPKRCEKYATADTVLAQRENQDQSFNFSQRFLTNKNSNKKVFKSKASRPIFDILSYIVNKFNGARLVGGSRVVPVWWGEG